MTAAQELADPNPAINNPDKFAWDRFIEINRPALEGRRGVPDPKHRGFQKLGVKPGLGPNQEASSERLTRSLLY